MNSTLLNRILQVLSFAGIFVAGYLTMAHWIGAKVACGASDGCGKVANSGYAFVPFGSGHDGKFGIPVAAFGLLLYAVLAAIAIVRSVKGDSSGSLTKLGLIASGLGTLTSAGFMYLSFFVIHAMCPWCMASAGIMTAIFVGHMLLKGVSERPAHFQGTFLAVVTVLTAVLLVWQIGRVDPPLKEIDMTIAELIPEKPHYYGDLNSKMVIIEFLDLTCPHCRNTYRELKRRIVEEKQKFVVVVRHFPLRGTEGREMALPAAAVSEILAEKGKFFNFVDMMYDTPEQEKLTVDKIVGYAVALGMDRDEVYRRMVDPEDPAFKHMQTDIEMGDKLGILQTPTFYLGPREKKAKPAKLSTFEEVFMLPEHRALWDPSYPGAPK